MSRGLSRHACRAACARFTPSNSGQRSDPTYYRGCWHVVSRSFFLGYRRSSSPRKAVYTPKGVIPHAALLRQACAHCGKFLAAASRRSWGRVSVPVWLAVLSDQLPIIALVSRDPTNQLIGRRLLLRRVRRPFPHQPHQSTSTCGITPRFRGLPPTCRADCPRVPHPSATPQPRRTARSTCMH